MSSTAWIGKHKQWGTENMHHLEPLEQCYFLHRRFENIYICMSCYTVILFRRTPYNLAQPLTLLHLPGGCMEEFDQTI